MGVQAVGSLGYSCRTQTLLQEEECLHGAR